MHYLISHKDTSIQVSFVFKAFLMNNGIHVDVTEKNKESVLNWFCEYAYFAIDKYDLHNFRISHVKFHPERFSMSFEIKNKKEVINEPSDNPECGTSSVTLIPTLGLFDVTKIIKMLLKPDPKKEIPLVLDEKLYYPIGYIPEY
jgi:hypothetical protein